MLISARVEAKQLGMLAKHFEQLGTRVRSKSQLINLIVEALLKELTEQGAMLDTNMSPAEAVDLFIRLGFEPPRLTKSEQEEAERTEDIRDFTEMVADAVARVSSDIL